MAPYPALSHILQLKAGQLIIQRLCANRAFRYRTASTAEEKLAGVVDRIWLRTVNNREFREDIAFKKALQPYVGRAITQLNSTAQSKAWERYALPWITSDAGLAWMRQYVIVSDDSAFRSKCVISHANSPDLYVCSLISLVNLRLHSL